MSVTVTTQAELDAALAANEAVVYIDSPEVVWLRLSNTGSSHVVARGSSHVVAWESSHVVATGSSHVVAWESSHVVAQGSSHVVAWESSHVVATGSSHVVARGSSHVVARGSSHVVARGSSHVVAWESSHVVATGSSHVVARGSSHVVAWESSHVVATGSSHVVAWESSHVVAQPYVSVHLHSGRATVEGGVLIDLTALDLSDPATWADFHGAQKTDEHLVVYKAVDDDLKSGRGFAYPLGTTVEAKDWKATDACGAGLHFGPTPHHAGEYFDGATRFLACRIPLSHAKGITDGGTAKVKAARCEVLFEVDIDGKPIQVEEATA